MNILEKSFSFFVKFNCKRLALNKMSDTQKLISGFNEKLNLRI